jgi:adenosylcobinamide kinase/adenosylcobinamide-phosphate guanylyltransferase
MKGFDMIVVMGGSGSGKSAFAENLILEKAAEGQDPALLYYIATMQVWDDEDRDRVEKHRKLRAGKGFTTIECPRDIGCVPERMPEVEKGAVLLECLTNLVANEMFGEGVSDEKGIDPARMSVGEGIDPENVITEKILADIQALEAGCRSLVVVTGNVFADGGNYSPETLAYMRVLGCIHQALVQQAEEVWEVVAGIPLRL